MNDDNDNIKLMMMNQSAVCVWESILGYLKHKGVDFDKWVKPGLEFTICKLWNYKWTMMCGQITSFIHRFVLKSPCQDIWYISGYMKHIVEKIKGSGQAWNP